MFLNVSQDVVMSVLGMLASDSAHRQTFCACYKFLYVCIVSGSSNTQLLSVLLTYNCNMISG